MSSVCWSCSQVRLLKEQPSIGSMLSPRRHLRRKSSPGGWDTSPLAVPRTSADGEASQADNTNPLMTPYQLVEGIPDSYALWGVV